MEGKDVDGLKLSLRDLHAHIDNGSWQGYHFRKKKE